LTRADIERLIESQCKAEVEIPNLGVARSNRAGVAIKVVVTKLGLLGASRPFFHRKVRRRIDNNYGALHREPIFTLCELGAGTR
jgi:hypothetical protein